MKYLKICSLFIFISAHACQHPGLPDIAFRRSLRDNYDPAKDVGLKKNGQTFAFGHHIPTKPAMPKKSEYALPFVRERLSNFKIRPPYVPSLRLRWSEVIAQRQKK